MAQAAAEYLDMNITDEMLEQALADGRLSIEADGDGTPYPDDYTHIEIRYGDDSLRLNPMPTYAWGDWLRADREEQLGWAREGLRRALENRSNMTDDELISWIETLY